MSKRKSIKLVVASFFSIVALAAGIALVILYFVLPAFKTDKGVLWGQVCVWAGVVTSVLGLLAVIVCVGLNRRADKREKAEANKRETVQQVEEPRVTYIPSNEVYEFVDMGRYQSLEDKFNEIGKMDRTQFVIYVARLFSRKGYQVKLTPVLDNHDIDLLVEKLGVTIAVGCLLTNRILCQEDIVSIKNGKGYYGVSNCMVITNMYFDRTALDFAKTEHMSLVDRNILAEDFMN